MATALKDVAIVAGVAVVGGLIYIQVTKKQEKSGAQEVLEKVGAATKQIVINTAHLDKSGADKAADALDNLINGNTGQAAIEAGTSFLKSSIAGAAFAAFDTTNNKDNRIAQAASIPAQVLFPPLGLAKWLLPGAQTRYPTNLGRICATTVLTEENLKKFNSPKPSEATLVDAWDMNRRRIVACSAEDKYYDEWAKKNWDINYIAQKKVKPALVNQKYFKDEKYRMDLNEKRFKGEQESYFSSSYWEGIGEGIKNTFSF